MNWCFTSVQFSSFLYAPIDLFSKCYFRLFYVVTIMYYFQHFYTVSVMSALFLQTTKPSVFITSLTTDWMPQICHKITTVKSTEMFNHKTNSAVMFFSGAREHCTEHKKMLTDASCEKRRCTALARPTLSFNHAWKLTMMIQSSITTFILNETDA